jgi:carbon-monoxide dehydrogenase small subunit
MGTEATESPARVDVALTVNGERHDLSIDPRWTLVDVLRTRLGLTGTHVGCEHGICGACTVLVDGLPARSCLVLAVQADGRSVETVESLASPDGTLHPLQEAFSRHRALQCGFCTPGFLMVLAGLQRESSPPTRERVHDAVAANLCRCTGYAGILAAADEVVGRQADTPAATS